MDYTKQLFCIILEMKHVLLLDKTVGRQPFYTSILKKAQNKH